MFLYQPWNQNFQFDPYVTDITDATKIIKITRVVVFFFLFISP